jgi:murein DD-endopeptidase MepM/ murein hydrolase activator NlpD
MGDAKITNEFRIWRSRVLSLMGAIGLVVGGLNLSTSTDGRSAIAQSQAELCPNPVLSRLQSHTVAAGETWESIATLYTLLPITLLAMNPAAQGRPLSPGTPLRIPPFNGAEVQVPAGQTWQDVAIAYRVRADVLFEINGCPETIPDRIFVPGVSWLLDTASNPPENPAEQTDDPLSAYPLAAPGTIVGNYGWQTAPQGDQLVFSSGVTVQTVPATAVQAAGTGTVAYIGQETGMGLLIVINHPQGLQTRYASIIDPAVEVGDPVQSGQAIAIAAPYANTANATDVALLYFEVRTNSALGWVARDPGDYIPELALK